MFSSERRDSTKIVYELLTLVKGGASKHQLVQDANLNSRLATRYTTQLEEVGLIRRDANLRFGDYRLTSKGEKVLKILSQLENELDAWDMTSAKASSCTTINSERVSLPATGEDLSGKEGTTEANQWMHTVKHLVGYLLVVLAGMGLGYLLP